MFRELPGALHPKEALFALGVAMTAGPEKTDDGKPLAALETADHLQDDEENSGISAGYTYLGQFIDHDITFDPSSSLMQQNDPESLVDFRTPRLDLDSVYGRGPADQPYMYIGDKFRLGKRLKARDAETPSRDLPRYRDPENAGSAARALIGDKRNDENVIVSQLHGTILQFHNRLGVASAADKKPRLQLFHWRHDPFMPLEFSVAAYRFGHSMVRPIYRLNTRLMGGDDSNQATADKKSRGLEGRFFIFAGVNKRALNGFGEFPDQWAIDWSLYFDIDGSGAKGGKHRAQPAYKIDTSLVSPLRFLPEFSTAVPFTPPLTVNQLQPKAVDGDNEPANLAVRNLLRGLSMQMPNGQAVARAMGLKAIVEEWPNAKPLTAIDPSFAGNAPLWYYILAEAQHEWFQRASKAGSRGDADPVTLGPVGGRTVAETLIGLVYGDGHSYLIQDPNWVPLIGGRALTMGKLIQYALSGVK